VQERNTRPVRMNNNCHMTLEPLIFIMLSKIGIQGSSAGSLRKDMLYNIVLISE
jgi:hypothetical protein